MRGRSGGGCCCVRRHVCPDLRRRWRCGLRGRRGAGHRTGRARGARCEVNRLSRSSRHTTSSTAGAGPAAPSFGWVLRVGAPDGPWAPPRYSSAAGSMLIGDLLAAGHTQRHRVVGPEPVAGLQKVRRHISDAGTTGRSARAARLLARRPKARSGNLAHDLKPGWPVLTQGVWTFGSLGVFPEGASADERHPAPSGLHHNKNPAHTTTTTATRQANSRRLAHVQLHRPPNGQKHRAASRSHGHAREASLARGRTRRHRTPHPTTRLDRCHNHWQRCPRMSRCCEPARKSQRSRWISAVAVPGATCTRQLTYSSGGEDRRHWVGGAARGGVTNARCDGPAADGVGENCVYKTAEWAAVAWVQRSR